jgi:hypothetical protein
MSGGAPRSVRSPFPRELLVEMFVNLFEVTGTEDSVRDQLDPPETGRDGPATGHDFQADVEEWLESALRRRSLISSPEP